LKPVRARSPFEDLQPAASVVVEASPAMWDGTLPALEAASIAAAAPKRVREFTAGRNCARAALLRLGFPAREIPVGSDRAPVFPAQVSGSITHADGYCAAAVIVRGEVDSLGIDAEASAPLDPNLASAVLSARELEAFARIERAPCDLPKLAFSAKEAFYKAYYQQTRAWLDFHDVALAFDPSRATFRITLVRNVDAYLRARSFEGRYAFDAERVYCAIALPPLLAIARGAGTEVPAR
jgi:4'-phosphopantetheinyl transferase EntD